MQRCFNICISWGCLLIAWPCSCITLHMCLHLSSMEHLVTKRCKWINHDIAMAYHVPYLISAVLILTMGTSTNYPLWFRQWVHQHNWIWMQEKTLFFFYLHISVVYMIAIILMFIRRHFTSFGWTLMFVYVNFIAVTVTKSVRSFQFHSH